MPIIGSEITIPEVKTDKYGIATLSILCPFLKVGPQLAAIIKPYATDIDGQDEFISGRDVSIVIHNLYEYAASDPEVGQLINIAIGAVFTALEAVAKKEGKI